jgi:hypothetical protein
MPAENKIITAQWTANEYTISYFENETTPLDIQGAPDRYDVEHSFTIPNPATRV